MGWVVNATPPPLYTRERDTELTVQEDGWAPGQGWTSAEHLSPIGILSPDCSAVPTTRDLKEIAEMDNFQVQFKKKLFWNLQIRTRDLDSKVCEFNS